MIRHRLSLLVLPHEDNNQRALLLQPLSTALFIFLFLLNQSLIKTITWVRPGILGYSSEITINKVIDLTNQERSNNQLPPLKISSSLSLSAENKARDMFASNYWAHNSPQGKTPWDFFREAGYDYSTAGENLARDFYDTDSMVKAWMRSPTHRANILNSKYREIGIGVINGTLNGIKTTLVVQHFATPVKAILGEENPDTISGDIVPQAATNPEVVITNLSGAGVKPLISPLAISKFFAVLIFFVLLTALVVDGYVTLKNKTHRLAASTAGHISFLFVIFILLLFTQQGSIF